MATNNSAMLFGDDEIDVRIGARVEGENLIFFFKNEQGEYSQLASYSQSMQKEYNKAKILGFKGTITEYFSSRDYT